MSCFQCPLCHLPLVRHDKHYRCVGQHCFDCAKEGYVNLLPVQFKRSTDPGDAPLMMAARRRETLCLGSLLRYVQPAPAVCRCVTGRRHAHLCAELRRTLRPGRGAYGDARPAPKEETLAGFAPLVESALRYPLRLTGAEGVALLRMTPFA